VTLCRHAEGLSGTSAFHPGPQSKECSKTFKTADGRVIAGCD
jgi:hypothetical protein